MRDFWRHTAKMMLALLVTGCFMMSCTKDDPGYDGAKKNIFIIYSIGYNNLNGALARDIDETIENFRPLFPSDILMIFKHNTKTQDYTVPSAPLLMQVSRNSGGRTIIDTLKVYPETTISASAETLGQVLSDIKEIHPVANYGILFSSHSTGWAPQDYCNDPGAYDPEADTTPEFDWMTEMRRKRPAQTWGVQMPDGSPMVKSFGAQAYKEGGETMYHEMDITDMAEAFPMKMGYIIFDSCLMGGIEVAYEFRNVCRHMVFSQTEILADGMDYKRLTSRVFSRNSMALIQVCKDYYNQYINSSATISLVDCSRLEGLADICRKIFDSRRAEIAAMEGSSAVQKYFRFDEHKWFYDLESIVSNAGTPEDMLMIFYDELDRCIIYKAATEKFLDLKINEHCGLSMYLPYAGYDYLNNFYKTLQWNKATGLVQ